MKQLEKLRARIRLATARMRLPSLRDREKKLQNRFHAKSTQKALNALWRVEEKIERLIKLPEVETRVKGKI